MGIAVNVESEDRIVYYNEDLPNQLRAQICNDGGDLEKELMMVVNSTDIVTMNKVLALFFMDMVDLKTLAPRWIPMVANTLVSATPASHLFHKVSNYRHDLFRIRKLWLEDTWELFPKKNITFTGEILPTLVGLYQAYRASSTKVSVETGIRMEHQTLVRLEHIRSKAIRNTFGLDHFTFSLVMDVLEGIPEKDEQIYVNVWNSSVFFIIVHLLLNNVHREYPRLAGMLNNLLSNIFD